MDSEFTIFAVIPLGKKSDNRAYAAIKRLKRKNST